MINSRGGLRFDAFLAAAVLAAALALAPIFALAAAAFRGDGAGFSHALRFVAPQALRQTLLLMGGVGLFALCVGAPAAWLVATRRFPGRRFVEAALLLPLALPVYVLAFAWTDLAHPVGPLQTGLRALLGYGRPADLRLPDLRSLPGAILIYGLALYPYVYVAARAAFLGPLAAQTEAARLLGASEAGVFFRVALPAARPALVAGLTLALMETLNDIGAAEFLSVSTLTTSIYSTWVNQSDLSGAARIALALLLLVFGLVVFERWARGLKAYAPGSARQAAPRPFGPVAGAAISALLLVPPVLGFFAPMAYLLRQAQARLAVEGVPENIVAEAVNAGAVATATTLCCVFGALLVAAAARFSPRSAGRRALLRLAGIGYAVPGTVLAIGLLVLFGAFDDLWRRASGARGLLLSASFVALVVALSLRFFRLALDKTEAGYERLPLSLDQSARLLGRSPAGTLRAVHWPLLRPTLAGAALLVFVDSMKELPATLLLRPLNFETLATHLYGEAARGTYENGALAACLIAAIGLVPVLLLLRVGARPESAAGAEP